MVDESFIAVGRNFLFASPVALVVLVTIVVGYFYFLSCLFTERTERSILFFKSFPVTDAKTVLSKLFTGVVLLPVLSLAAFAIAQAFVLIVTSAALLLAGGSLGTIWNASALFSNWLLVLYVLVSCALWYAPFIAFLMLVSAWAKKAVLLWSMVPFFIIQAEFLLPVPRLFGPIVLGHMRGYVQAAFEFRDEVEAGAAAFGNQPLNFLSLTDPVGLITQPALWVGLVIAAALMYGAIYLRRYRDDS
jgi:ABC-2 type transport system permease protein